MGIAFQACGNQYGFFPQAAGYFPGPCRYSYLGGLWDWPGGGGGDYSGAVVPLAVPASNPPSGPSPAALGPINLMLLPYLDQQAKYMYFSGWTQKNSYIFLSNATTAVGDSNYSAPCYLCPSDTSYSPGGWSGRPCCRNELCGQRAGVGVLV